MGDSDASGQNNKKKTELDQAAGRAWAFVEKQPRTLIHALEADLMIARKSRKVFFGVVCVVLAIALPWLWPLIKKPEWIASFSLSPLQVLYAIISLEVSVAVYVWGVGSWSRYEPPKQPSPSVAPPSLGLPEGQQVTPPHDPGSADQSPNAGGH